MLPTNYHVQCPPVSKSYWSRTRRDNSNTNVGDVECACLPHLREIVFDYVTRDATKVLETTRQTKIRTMNDGGFPCALLVENG